MPETLTAPCTDNRQVADRLGEIADLLEAQRANPWRVRAYRTAAETVRQLEQPVGQLLRERGTQALLELPGIGRSMAAAIERLVTTGRHPLLSRLRGDLAVPQVFATVPGIGPELAERIWDELGIATLAELEAAANDGRLARVPGFGPRRIRGIRESLRGRLHVRRSDAWSRPATPVEDEPPVDELLDVDREYRDKASQGRLLTIAPRRFNPTHEAWLPILHTERGRRHYTALYSNTARAHQLGTTRDWVVIYRDDEHGEGQWTVVTSLYEPLRGRRIVRGREDECAEHYRRQAAPQAEPCGPTPALPALENASGSTGTPPQCGDDDGSVTSGAR